MEDVLNIIREVAEQLDDPPEIQPESMIRDEQMVEELSQTPSTSEQFTSGAQPELQQPQVIQPPAWNLRQMQDLTMPAVAVNQPSAPVPAEPQVFQPFRAPVAEAYRPEPRQASEPQIYEPLRVAAAAATANLRENFQTTGAQFDGTARVEHQTVTPTMRVSHMVPDAFPVDFQHALQLIDKNISLPNMEIDTDPPSLPDYAPLEPLQSSEQVVVDMSFVDDADERNIL